MPLSVFVRCGKQLRVGRIERNGNPCGCRGQKTHPLSADHRCNHIAPVSNDPSGRLSALVFAPHKTCVTRWFVDKCHAFTSCWDFYAVRRRRRQPNAAESQSQKTDQFSALCVRYRRSVEFWYDDLPPSVTSAGAGWSVTDDVFQCDPLLDRLTRQ
jgi:hypothetical protein